MRHAINGLFGIGIGALLALARPVTPKDFYLPGILYTLGYGVAMIGSVVAGRPLVGWIWSLVADKGGDAVARRRRAAAHLRLAHVVWATIFFAKVVVNLLGLLRRRPHRGPEGEHPRHHADRARLPALRPAARADRLGGAALPARPCR